MLLSEWNRQTYSDKAQQIYKAWRDIVSSDQVGYFTTRHSEAYRAVIEDLWIFDRFLLEIIAAINAGKTSYSSQRIYEYLAHDFMLLDVAPNFTAKVQMGDVLARLAVVLFPSELSNFFDDQGVSLCKGNK